MLWKLLSWILGQKRADAVIDQAVRQRGGRSIFQSLAEVLDLRLKVSQADLGRIPVKGRVVVVANHPAGFADGVLLGLLCDRARTDVETIGHTWFERYPDLARRMLLVVFPAGKVAHFHRRGMRVADSAWQPGVSRLLIATRATVLPVHVSGRNSLLFQLLSMVHPRLGALRLIRELFLKAGKTMDVRIGKPISFKELSENRSEREITEYLQRLVEGLRPMQNRLPSRPSIRIDSCVDQL